MVVEPSSWRRCNNSETLKPGLRTLQPYFTAHRPEPCSNMAGKLNTDEVSQRNKHFCSFVSNLQAFHEHTRLNFQRKTGPLRGLLSNIPTVSGVLAMVFLTACLYSYSNFNWANRVFNCLRSTSGLSGADQNVPNVSILASAAALFSPLSG